MAVSFMAYINGGEFSDLCNPESKSRPNSFPIDSRESFTWLVFVFVGDFFTDERSHGLYITIKSPPFGEYV